MEQAFRKFDIDGNGKVTVIEFIECLKKFNLFEDEIKNQIELIDRNKDGIITFNEFELFFS